MGLNPVKTEPLKWGEEPEDTSIWGKSLPAAWGEVGNLEAKAWDELISKREEKEHTGTIWELL